MIHCLCQYPGCEVKQAKFPVFLQINVFLCKTVTSKGEEIMSNRKQKGKEKEGKGAEIWRENNNEIHCGKMLLIQLHCN